MQYAEPAAKLAQYRQQIAELRNRMRELQRSVEPEKVADYEFSTAEGKVRCPNFSGKSHTSSSSITWVPAALLHIVG